jgi:hypothetical protein
MIVLPIAANKEKIQRCLDGAPREQQPNYQEPIWLEITQGEIGAILLAAQGEQRWILPPGMLADNIPEAVKEKARERRAHEFFIDPEGCWFVKNHSSAEGIWFDANANYVGYGSISDNCLRIKEDC